MPKPVRTMRRIAASGILAAVFFPYIDCGAELPDPSLLPPAATVKIDFATDVALIFEAKCLRCHGEEKVKSGLSLATRERALKGGYEGPDILPGDSTASPLIYYVARLVEDMEMPPEGKAEPLTEEQVGMLRAWIDQGAKWTNAPESTTSGSVTPAAGWIDVSGDRRAFREFEGVREQWTGGLAEFSLTTRFEDGRRVEVSGRALAPDDYRISLELSQPNLGFVQAGAEKWRRYYDDLGGYNPNAIPSSYRLGEDLGLDIGRAWFDVGLTLPRAPTIVLGYEYQFRNGDKSTLQWGLANNRAIYPASKDIDEHVHILKLDLDYELLGWTLEDNARVEWYENTTRRNNTYQEAPPPVVRFQIDEKGDHVRGANTFRVEKQLTDWWLLSLAHFYSRLSGNSSYAQTWNPNLPPRLGGVWFTPRIELDSESQVLSAAGSFQPLQTLSASIGLQGEYTRQSGFGPIDLDDSDPSTPPIRSGSLDSSSDRLRWSELAEARFTGIPFTVVFADARLDQENGSQYEQESDGSTATQLRDVQRDTDFTLRSGDWRVGFQISQWRFAALNAHYRERFNHNEYDHLQDLGLGFQPGSGAGYSAFIRQRDVNGEEFRVSLTLKPRTWLRAQLTYKYDETTYQVETDSSPFPVSPGGGIDSGLTRGNHYSLGVTAKPWRRLGVGGSIGYIDSETRTARNEITSVTDYAGYNWWARGTAAFVLSEKDDLFCSYEYWRSDYGQSHSLTGLPLGSDYTRHALQIGLTRQWNEHLRSSLRYGFYNFDDRASGGARNYTAHGLFAAMTYGWR